MFMPGLTTTWKTVVTTIGVTVTGTKKTVPKKSELCRCLPRTIVSSSLSLVRTIMAMITKTTPPTKVA